ncbi:hypothetical protein D9M70_498020 [compost metagenome]
MARRHRVPLRSDRRQSLAWWKSAALAGSVLTCGAPRRQPRLSAGTAAGRSGFGRGGLHRRGRRPPGSSQPGRPCRNIVAPPQPNAPPSSGTRFRLQPERRPHLRWPLPRSPERHRAKRRHPKGCAPVATASDKAAQAQPARPSTSRSCAPPPTASHQERHHSIRAIRADEKPTRAALSMHRARVAMPAPSQTSLRRTCNSLQLNAKSES